MGTLLSTHTSFKNIKSKEAIASSICIAIYLSIPSIDWSCLTVDSVRLKALQFLEYIYVWI